MPRNYLMLAVSPENYGVTRDQRFTVQGMRGNQKRKVQRVEVGDRVLYYLTGVQKFAATATATSTLFEEHTPLWSNHNPDEDFPWRIKMKPAVVLDEDQFIDAKLIAPRMDYVKKWIPEWWPLAFVGDIHIIPKKDFLLLEEEMKKLARTNKQESQPGASPA